MNLSLRFELVSPQIAQLTLARPERSNAFSLELLRLFVQKLDEIRTDSNLRVLFLTAEGKNFCGGLDLAEASQSEENARTMPTLVVEILTKLRHLPQTVITAAHGAARAGGGALIAASDIVVAAENFNIAFPEIHRGLEPVLLFPLLRRKWSVAALSELLLTGQPVNASRAKELGLVHQITSDGSELSAVKQIAETICRADAGAVRTAKELILAHETTLAGCPLEEEFRQSLENHLVSWHSASAYNGVTAFLEKR